MNVAKSDRYTAPSSIVVRDPKEGDPVQNQRHGEQHYVRGGQPSTTSWPLIKPMSGTAGTVRPKVEVAAPRHTRPDDQPARGDRCPPWRNTCARLQNLNATMPVSAGSEIGPSAASWQNLSLTE
jgi:hypothetical protein